MRLTVTTALTFAFLILAGDLQPPPIDIDAARR
jgi:hypothetical protein